MIIENKVLKVILGWNNLFMYPNFDWTLFDILNQMLPPIRACIMMI
jgi:hypothetical protein